VSQARKRNSGRDKGKEETNSSFPVLVVGNLAARLF
jgi:hypothetical protein